MTRLVAFALILAAAPAFAHGAGGTLDPSHALPFLALGFAVGLAHALDADHVAAVAAMVGRGGSRLSIVARGAAWGIGHTAALFVICSVVLLLGLTISDRVGSALELVVGVMIVLLGVKVFWTLWRERVHIHVHEHDGVRHFHAHSHRDEPADHGASPHDHRHPARALLPTLGVGLVHGAAGSAGLLVLIVAGAGSTGEALLAFAVFGLGSLIGMTLLTAVASYPLSYINRGAAWMRVSLALTIGCLAVIVGGAVTIESLQQLAYL
jgi:ABC-type nickel/cobalt efflux system permease component RcnA